MINVLMHGCCGRMGQMISSLCETSDSVKIVAGVDIYDNGKCAYPVFASIDKCDIPYDVVIDFSNASIFDSLMDYCVANKKPIVLCTTGLSEAQINKVKESSKEIAILKSANMSIGINMLIKLLKEITPVLADEGFDIEIVEKHHNQKLDAPSGTALALGDACNEALDEKYEYIFDRSQRREVRPKKEIGFSAVRGGTIVGDHDVIFAGTDEVITLSHTAYSRNVFAKGAIAAAAFLYDKKPGWYDMSDVIG